MTYTRCYEELSNINFENSGNKKVVPIELFCIRVLQEINGVKYLYNNMLIGAMDAVSHKYQIKCNESYKEVFEYIGNTLRDMGW